MILIYILLISPSLRYLKYFGSYGKYIILGVMVFYPDPRVFLTLVPSWPTVS